MRTWLERRRFRKLLQSEEGRALLILENVREEVFQSLFERLMRFDEERGIFVPKATALSVHAVKKLHRRIVMKLPSRRARKRARA